MVVSEEMAIRDSEPAYFAMLEKPAKEGKLNNDPKLKARVDGITARLIAQAITYRPETAEWTWSVHVIDDPEVVNAWCMAGGRMAVYTGLIEKVQPTDDELAQVMGHEIAHALAKHTAEKMSVALGTSIAVGVFAASQKKTGAALAAGALAAKLAVTLPNSRKAETEADRIGIELAAKAGYDPHAAVSLWEKMAKVSEGKAPPQFLSTHPSSDTRIKELKELVPQMLPYYEQKGERAAYQFKPEASQLK